VRPIRGPVFHYPRGWRYRRWHAGLILPRIFLSSPYFWTNWAALGLYPPPPGYVWVRYGPDLLLVNRYTGRIRDVIYGAFY
jgi:Ni/Co efflux regulator RcnB